MINGVCAAKLLPLLQRSLRPTARVVSYVWEMPTPVEPTRTVLFAGSGAPLHLFDREALLAGASACASGGTHGLCESL